VWVRSETAPTDRTSALQQRDTLAVTHVEAFDLNAAVIKVYAAVGEYSIDVEQEKFDLPRLVLNGQRNAFHRA
jgi:hypothetical protein